MRKQSPFIVAGILLVNVFVTSVILDISGCDTSASENTVPADNRCGCYTDDSAGDGYEKSLLANYPIMSNPIPINISDINDDFVFSESPILDLPSYFSWKDYEGKDWMTPARDQGDCGSCWLFGAMGTFESVINIKEGCADLNPDLSEQYVLSCIPEAGSCNGGDPYNCAFHYIMNTSALGNYHNGVILEKCFTYQSNFDHTPLCSKKDENWEEHLVPISNFWQSGFWNVNDPDLIDTIKSLIYTKGPVYSLYWVSDYFKIWGTLHHNSSDYYRDLGEDCLGYVNHGIVIVGWKDDPSIGNGGYWIVKNSWGSEWGYDGFFNLEYDCLNMGAFVAWVDYDPTSFDWEPIADAGGFYQGNVGQEVPFDGGKSFDAEGEIVSYYWDFGDGTHVTGFSPSHIYSQSGIYTVTLTVTDSGDNTAKDTTVAGIGELPIEIDILGGLGITIVVRNLIEEELTNLDWSVDLSGLLVTGKTKSGLIGVIPASGEYTFKIPVIGIGSGTITVAVANVPKITNFFTIGPFVLMC